MNGNILKQWCSRYLGLILPEGDYVAQDEYEGRKWGRYTKDDKIIWEKDETIHHDIVWSDDRLITFIKETHEYRSRDVDFCVIVEYDMDGNEISRWSTWDKYAFPDNLLIFVKNELIAGDS